MWLRLPKRPLATSGTAVAAQVVYTLLRFESIYGDLSQDILQKANGINSFTEVV
jgi:hypothetical protein